MVLDAAPMGRRPEPGWLEALESGDASRIVPLALARPGGSGMTLEELSLVVPAGTLDGGLSATENDPEIIKLGNLYAPAAEIKDARKRLLKTLKKRAGERPESPELSVAEARTATGLGALLADALVSELSGSDIRVGDSGVRLPDANEVPPELESAAEEVLMTLRRAGTEPPTIEMTPAVRLLLKRGGAVRLGDGLFGARETADEILDGIKEVCRQEGELTLAAFRDKLGTTRKFAQAWLEYADAEDVTRRVGDARVLTRRYR